MQFELTEQLANDILRAEDVCFNEGAGPRSEEWEALIRAAVDIAGPIHKYILTRYERYVRH